MYNSFSKNTAVLWVEKGHKFIETSQIVALQYKRFDLKRVSMWGSLLLSVLLLPI